MVSSSIVGVWRLISEKGVRGAKLSCLVKMSKMQARQTSVVYSVTVPEGNSVRSSSRCFAGMRGGFTTKTRRHETEIPITVVSKFRFGCSCGLHQERSAKPHQIARTNPLLLASFIVFHRQPISQTRGIKALSQ